MRLKSLLPVISGALFLSASTAAFAHPGHGDEMSLMQGLAHPLTGVDHMLAMVMVGLFAVQIGGRALWQLPATFMAAMAIGAMAGVTSISASMVELGIGLSVVLLGAVIALQARWSLVGATLLGGAVALVHGQAHGAEAAGEVSAAYVAGFLLSTALLHAAGIAGGVALHRIARDGGRVAGRITGAAAAAAGLLLIAH